MRVYKFGGASVKDAEGVRNLAQIVSEAGKPLMVIVSAMGKTTNALEKVAESSFSGNYDEAIRLFGEVLAYHNAITDELGIDTPERAIGFIAEVCEILTRGAGEASYDEWYDKIVGYGELFSTSIVADVLHCRWLDMRSVFVTDAVFRSAEVDYQHSKKLLINAIGDDRLVVGQGFIGGTIQGQPTTLGREGSDYSASLAAAMTDAESMTVWKDVAGVYDSDPKTNPNAEILPVLSYADTDALLAKGAQILHPKTIAPLAQRSIPLYVRCFFDPKAEGSVIK